MVNALIAVAVIAWMSQILLSGWQMHRFNQALTRLSAAGKVGVGRAGGRFRPRVIVAVAVDEQLCITDSFIMKGISVFARPAAIDGLRGRSIAELQTLTWFADNRNSQQALSQALMIKNR